MDLQSVKNSVQNKQLIKGVTIFVCKHGTFIPLQYVEWYLHNGIEVEYVDELSNLFNTSVGLFDSFIDYSSKLYVFSCELFDADISKIFNLLDTDKNVFIICEKVSEEIQTQFSDNIVVVPKLESWQIEDLAYSMADGAEQKDIEYILKICGKDINRLYKELEKISLFSVEERKSVVKDFIYDGIFNDLSHYSIFDLSTCIIKRDINNLKVVYGEINNIDCDPLGLVGILIKNFRDIISVQCANNPTPETCGLDSKKFWAVKYSCGFYNRDQLVKIYEMLTSIDRRLKTGELNTDFIIDYIITYILSV